MAIYDTEIFWTKETFTVMFANVLEIVMSTFFFFPPFLIRKMKAKLNCTMENFKSSLPLVSTVVPL